jgi:hypothetical protein
VKSRFQELRWCLHAEVEYIKPVKVPAYGCIPAMHILQVGMSKNGLCSSPGKASPE